MWLLCPQNEGAEAVETKSGADEAMYGLAPFVSFAMPATMCGASSRVSGIARKKVGGWLIYIKRTAAGLEFADI